jgi:hypothetical protein
MTDLQIRRTSIIERSETEATVEIWISDAEDPTVVTYQISISVKLEYTSNPSLAEVQAKALLRAQAVIAEQIEVKTELANRPA